jgi:hypothetical protein
MQDPDSELLQPARTITEDIQCTRCGYNLRGLTLDKLCPECAAPVARSIHGRLLRYADPDWLDRLRLGALVMLWTLLIGLAGAIGVVIATQVGAPGVVASVPILLAAALRLWAAFLVTTSEPTIALEEDPFALRRVVRACAVVGFLGEALGEPGGIWSALLPLGTVLVGIATHFGLCVYFRRFALRIPDEKLARSTTIVMWGYGISFALAAILIVLAMALMGTAPAPGGPAAGTTLPGAAIAGFAIFGCLGSVGWLIFGIWYIVLLFSYHAAFKKAAAEARQTTGHDDTPLAISEDV